MVPIYLDPQLVRIGLAGRGALTLRRLKWLRDLGAEPLVYSDKPDEALSAEAGPDMIHRLPNGEDLAALTILWVADLEENEAEELGRAARAAKVLLNTEDVLPLCDFHTPSIVKRGRLVLSAGTGGSSPAAASYVRQKLEQMFPEAWEAALEELRASRLAMKTDGANMGEVKAASMERLIALFGPI